ncbi:metallophosphoesterase [Gracilibacillus oryzae]|nr:metallophosphoesterase [Gracilibacillus oryzae]
MLKKLLYMTGLISTFGLLSKVYYDTNFIKTASVTLLTDKLKKGNNYSILQISDLHNKTFGKNHQRILKEIKKAKTDLIVITGDLIDRKTTKLDSVILLVKEMRKVNPNILYITGNHEWDNPLTSELLLQLKKQHVQVLDDKEVHMQANEGIIHIIGTGRKLAKSEKLIHLLEHANPDNFILLLSHIPNVVKHLSGRPIDLILSGHTHGGQIRFPYVGSVVVPDQGVFPAFDQGIYEWEEGKLLYIDSGAGTTRLPVRFLNQSQISIIHLIGNR